ncbi:MAG: hypothetical protein ABUL71_04175, partial [Gemmatimonadota bacterium]
RCPIFSSAVYQSAVQDPKRIGLLVHDDGVVVPDLNKVYTTQVAHDPRDIEAARRIADMTDRIHLGVFFRDPSRPRYEDIRRVPPRTADERLQQLEVELDKYAV